MFQGQVFLLAILPSSGGTAKTLLRRSPSRAQSPKSMTRLILHTDVSSSVIAGFRVETRRLVGQPAPEPKPPLSGARQSSRALWVRAIHLKQELRPPHFLLLNSQTHQQSRLSLLARQLGAYLGFGTISRLSLILPTTRRVVLGVRLLELMLARAPPIV